MDLLSDASSVLAIVKGVVGAMKTLRTRTLNTEFEPLVAELQESMFEAQTEIANLTHKIVDLHKEHMESDTNLHIQNEKLRKQKKKLYNKLQKCREKLESPGGFVSGYTVR